MEVEEIRNKISEIDNKIIDLIVERFKLVKGIAVHKFKGNLPLRDQKREAELVEERNKQFEKMGFRDSNFVKEFYKIIIDKSVKLQKNYLKKHRKDKIEADKIKNEA